MITSLYQQSEFFSQTSDLYIHKCLNRVAWISGRHLKQSISKIKNLISSFTTSPYLSWEQFFFSCSSQLSQCHLWFLLSWSTFNLSEKVPWLFPQIHAKSGCFLTRTLPPWFLVNLPPSPITGIIQSLFLLLLPPFCALLIIKARQNFKKICQISFLCSKTFFANVPHFSHNHSTKGLRSFVMWPHL